MILRTAVAVLVPLVALVISAQAVTSAYAESAVIPTKEASNSVTGTTTVAPSTESTISSKVSISNEIDINFDVPGLSSDVLRMALAANDHARDRGIVNRPGILTVIDYSLPSTAKRLWVLDLDAREVLYHELTSHGQGSGGNMTTSFSNVSMSLQSNIGVMTTAETYYGKNGYSLRLDGRELGYNDQARPRAIVIHGADYVSEEFIRRTGRLGRSWGCPALERSVNRELIDTIKGGSLVFGYFPDQDWLENSEFVRHATERGVRIADVLSGANSANAAK
jgi:hypothetical protein